MLQNHGGDLGSDSLILDDHASGYPGVVGHRDPASARLSAPVREIFEIAFRNGRAGSAVNTARRKPDTREIDCMKQEQLGVESFGMWQKLAKGRPGFLGKVGWKKDLLDRY